MDFEFVLTNFAAVIGGSLIGIGLSAMVFPKWAATMFGINAPGTGLHYVTAAGVRDVFIGHVILLVWWAGYRGLLGNIIMSTAVISTTDVYLTYKYGTKSRVLIHAFGTVAVLVYGYLLLRF